MNEYIEKPDMQYILHIKSDKKVEKRLIDYCLESVVDVFEDTGLTADVQPVKYGRWENTNTPNQLRCSNCEIIHFIAQYPHGDIKYCPNCGARMDGDTECHDTK